MPCKEGLGNYEFCKNSPYYNGLLKYFEDNKANTGKIPETNCSLSTTMIFKDNITAQDICKEFTYIYKFFLDYKGKHTKEEDIYSYSDCDFLNYWLNDKLRNSVKDGGEIDVRGFYQEIKNKNESFFSDNKNLENYMKNIDPEILKNMKLLYDLYDYERTILNILLNPDHTDTKNNVCPVYREHCLKKYVEAINRCYGIYDEFYKALKDFKSSYNYTIVQGNEDRYNCRGDTEYELNDYDPVLEREEKKSMLIQGSTSPLIVLLLIPLIYKFTPVGPFLQGKIKNVKNMWKSPKKNKEQLLSSSSMDIRNNISDNGEYKLAYNSVTNE
ncbi:VIR protein [Plasmodium vivax]|uniref:VIR protein n=1 Tax=Plasmodium vivax TaxID=5855 RepID=A0A1G4E4G3_PLAVI|nr:VIR protein [Plasmodium vivax]